MKELSLEEKARAYDKALKRAKELISRCIDDRDRRTKVYRVEDIESIFPELKESEDERIKKAITHVLYENYTDAAVIEGVEIAEIITWLEKQGKQSVEPEWCHHKVDLSDCSEEYRKAYYDGWNNCNMQHSQCEDENTIRKKRYTNMGTNYYIKQKPLIQDVNLLTSLIKDTLDDQNVDYQEIKDIVNELYCERTPLNLNGRVIHIGKNSGGWKFLWNPNIVEIPKYAYINGEFVVMPSIYDKVYELTKESIREFVMRPENILIDEYGDIQDKEKFLEWAFNKDGLDSESYAKKYNDESVRSEYPETERQELWKKLGFTFNSIYQHDFYSDGLRFSTSVEFS